LPPDHTGRYVTEIPCQSTKATRKEDRHGDDGGKQLPALQQQYKSLMAAAAKASPQAAKL